MRVGSWARGVTHRVTLCGGTERRCRRLLAEGAAGGGAEAGAAVLVPLCSVRGRPALLYTLRCSRLRGPYGGDVSFPGGKREAADGGAEGTALREAREELGLNLREERVWGRLRELPDRNGDEDNAGTWGQCGEYSEKCRDGKGTWGRNGHMGRVCARERFDVELGAGNARDACGPCGGQPGTPGGPDTVPKP
ncbi:nucleoside diphosphate-linked moiety X motif 8 isoform X4 [Lagopus leucura]|uniref:nucleoside diphosphate-linked moiety X motif 8 isoform X4 n=1 Tax=Lagopus leucura TaxID=30410 RepID=UPI001C66CAF8|nr:nucleoside diphosphate-linked moiety X motif 8 isoform X4 [Lagopus leucura]